MQGFLQTPLLKVKTALIPTDKMSYQPMLQLQQFADLVNSLLMASLHALDDYVCVIINIETTLQIKRVNVSKSRPTVKILTYMQHKIFF